MAIANQQNLLLAIPAYKPDQIIGSITNTLTIPPSSGVTTDIKAHGFGDSAYFDGIFTTDGGFTWNDFGSQTPDLSGSFPQFDTLGVAAMVDTANLNVYVTNSTSNAYVVTYKVYLLAKNSMNKPLKPLSTTQALTYSTGYNFQKIFKQDTVNFVVSLGNIGVVDILHNLGYIPKLRAYFLPTDNPTQVFKLSQAAIPPTSGPQIQTRITDTTLTFYADESSFLSGQNISGNIEYRIYLDQ